MKHALLLVILCSIFNSAFAELVHNKRLYGYIYWENGLPTQDLNRFPNSWANADMAAEPNLIIQTGYYNLRFDLDDVDLTGFDASQGSDYMSALTEDVTTFSDGKLVLRAYKNGVAYTAKKAIVEDGLALTSRLIEGGQYVQRFDNTGLVFTDSNGNELEEKGYFEVTAWPDRVVFTLDFSDHDDITRTTIMVTAPDGTNLLLDKGSNKINLGFMPQNKTVLSTLNPSSYIANAQHKNTGDEVAVSFEQDTHAFRFDIAPAKRRLDYPTDMNEYDEYVFEVSNPTNGNLNIPLVFQQTSVHSVTGTVMTLVEDDDGRPTGVPVQISKNWHKTIDHRVKHDGTWLRGSSMVTLAANSKKTLRLRVIYGYWGEMGTASHSQLSLIGYGNNNAWQWDESALGTWGEAMTFDPYQSIAGAFIADVRPSWTPPMKANATDHSWTENTGGGNFLVYFDQNGDHRWPKKLKTAYRWTGPNMTEVLYSGVTDDDAIRFTYKTQLVASNDYHRRFQSYKYEVLKDISPSRLSYYQMGADFYNLTEIDSFYLGRQWSLTNSEIAQNGGNGYKKNFAFNNKWLSPDDKFPESNTSTVQANRGLLWRESKVNGKDANVYLHTYGRTWGRDTTLFEVSGSSTSQSYSQGTVITGELGYIMPAKSISQYWGNDPFFIDRLSNNNSQPWQMVQHEYGYNNFNTAVGVGTLEKNYPVEIKAGASANIIAYFTVPANRGIGHIPVTVKDAPAGLALRTQYKLQGSDEWVWAVENTDHISNNEFYQGYLNADGTMDYVFNIARPAGSISKSMAIRVFYNKVNEPSENTENVISNPIDNSDMAVDGSASEWSKLQLFADDSNDVSNDVSNTIDWHKAGLAHSNDTVFMQYENYGSIDPTASSGSFLSWGWQTYLDTDNDPTTGYQYNDSIGAEILIEGDQIFRFGGGDGWDWQSAGAATIRYDNNIAELSFPRDLLGSHDTIKLAFYGNNEASEGTTTDHYPNNSGFEYFFSGGGFADTSSLEADDQEDSTLRSSSSHEPVFNQATNNVANTPTTTGDDDGGGGSLSGLFLLSMWAMLLSLRRFGRRTPSVA